jgi:penicillin-binding protein 2
MPKNPFSIYNKSSLRDAHIDRSIEEHTLHAAPRSSNGPTVRKIGLPVATVPLKAVLIFCTMLLIAMILRVFLLQMVNGAQYREQAEQNRIQTVTVPALRGTIYDTDGKALVKNVPNFQLTVDASDLRVRNEEAIAKSATEISRAVEGDRVEIEEALINSLINGAPTVLREYMPYEEATALMIAVDSISGVQVGIRYNREYATGEEYSHILGYISKMTKEDYDELQDDGYLLNDFLGKSGIENSYEGELRGVYGTQELEVDFQGRKKTLLNETQATPGKNVHLTIDTKLQESLYAKLRDVSERFSLPGASAVAIDPRNGHVLAAVSYPAYDNNIFTGEFDNAAYAKALEDERNRFLNRPVSGTYPSGSTFKPIVAAAALEEDIINEGTTFNSTGGIEIEGYTYPDWKSGGHGITNVTKALAESVNTFFYYIGGGDNEDLRGLGVERIREYAEAFGLNSPLGIDLPGEASGFLPSKDWKEEVKNEPWFLGNTYNLSIGQGDILVTPLQVAAYTAAIANGGTLYQPTLLKKMNTPGSDDVQKSEPVVLNEQVVSPQSIAIVQKGMREAVAYGSARKLNTSLPVSSAAKTGTAEFGQGDKTHAWFTTYAPYEEPEIALTVLLEEGGGGDEYSLDVAEEALYEYFTDSE